MTYRGKPRYTAMPNDSYPVLQGRIAYNQYGGYCVPISSCYSPAAQQIYAGNVYEPQTIGFLVSHSGPGDIVHAGAYFGDFLPALSRSCAPDAKIWAFEPNPENYRCALITTIINGLQNIELTNAGLGDQPGSLAMVTTDAQGRALGGRSYIPAQGIEPAGTETIRIVTVDEVVSSTRKVSIIHLDVEGYEKQALGGALKTIQRWSPILLLERLPEQPWLSAHISQLGYRVAQTIHFNTVLVRD